MAHDPHSRRTDTPTTTGSDSLAPDEAMHAMRASGGYVVVRYDLGDTHIDYRYCPTTGHYEQATVGTRDDHTLDSYVRLDAMTTETMLTPPEGYELTTPTVLAYPDTHFPTIGDQPRTLGFTPRGTGEDKEDRDE